MATKKRTKRTIKVRSLRLKKVVVPGVGEVDDKKLKEAFLLALRSLTQEESAQMKELCAIHDELASIRIMLENQLTQYNLPVLKTRKGKAGK